MTDTSIDLREDPDSGAAIIRVTAKTPTLETTVIHRASQAELPALIRGLVSCYNHGPGPYEIEFQFRNKAS